RHAEPHLRAKSVKDALNRVRRVIKPLLGSRPVEAVTKAELQDLHTGLSLTPYEANRVRALLSVMFGQAVEWGWRAYNPVQGIKPYAEGEAREVAQRRAARAIDRCAEDASQQERSSCSATSHLHGYS